MSTAQDIEAMLDRVAERQIRCPECERSDDLYIARAEWCTRMVAAPIGGGLVEGDTDSDYVAVPSDIIPTLPTLVACGNHPVYEEATAGCVFDTPPPAVSPNGGTTWTCSTHNTGRWVSAGLPMPTRCRERRAVTTLRFFTVPDDTEVTYDNNLLADLKGWNE